MSDVPAPSRAAMALRLIAGADDFRSRVRLTRYFASSQIRRVLKIAPGRRTNVQLSIGGIRWDVDTASSQLGGIHDVVLGREYDAFDGFVAGPGAVVVDIGANVGAYTLWQASNMKGSGMLVAVEASPSTLAVLRRNIAANRAEVQIVESAVWSSTGEVEFVASERSSSTAGVASTLDLDLVRDAARMTVSALSLDELLATGALAGRDIDLVKLDVEGAELVILEGAADATLGRIRRLVVEVDERTWHGVQQVLDANGLCLIGRHRNVGYFARD